MTNDEVVAEIEARFKKAAQEYAKRSAALVAWVAAGNPLPEVYR